jgi:polar amino acid transport system substrate-binding protein
MNPMQCRIIFLITLLLTLSALAVGERLPVKVYAYHLKPPYMINIGSETGLYYDFSRYINSKQTKYELHTVFVPRKRIDSYISSKQLDGVLVGVNPIWFNDRSLKKYLWTASIVKDQDEIVSSVNKPFEYTSPSSLVGKRIGGVKGFYYFGIDELVNKGKIERFDAENEKLVLNLILGGRVDVGVVSRSTVQYLVMEEEWVDKFHLSLIPHDSFVRRVMVPHSYQDVYDVIAPIIKNINQDNDWRRILRKYSTVLD